MKRRVFTFLVIVCCFALLAIGGRAVVGSERLLLQRAITLRWQDVNDKPKKSESEEDTSDAYDSYSWERQWVSNEKVAELHLNRYHHPTLYSIVHHDLHTGVATLKHVPFSQQLEERYSDPVLSPDGQWLLWRGWGNGKEMNQVWNMTTSQHLSWPAGMDDYRHFTNYWLADSRHWLEYVTVPRYVTLHDIQNPQSNIRMTLPPLPNRANIYDEYMDCFVTSHNRLVISEDELNTLDKVVGLTLREYELQPEQGKVVRLKTYHAMLPEGLRHLHHAFSFAGDRILWTTVGIREDPMQVWLRRAMRKPPPSKQTWVSLWTSRLDGSDWREVGHIVVPLTDDADELERGDRDRVIQDAGWLPDGKKAWFKYKDAYYTVVVD